MKLTNIRNISIQGTINSPSQFFSKLFESRDMAHIYHLRVNSEVGSFAAHSALGSYYEDVLDLIDELIETYQGQFGLVDEYIIDLTQYKSVDRLIYFENLANYITENRNTIPVENTHLQNIIDEILALVYRTIYKLKFLK